MKQELMVVPGVEVLVFPTFETWYGLRTRPVYFFSVGEVGRKKRMD